MSTCEGCNRTVKDGKLIDHWICEDCQVTQKTEGTKNTNE